MLVHCVVKPSRPSDLKSSSNISLPFAWITGLLKRTQNILLKLFFNHFFRRLIPCLTEIWIFNWSHCVCVQRVPGRMAYPAGKVRGIERWKLERNIPRGVLSCFHLPYTNHIGLKSFSRQIDQNVPPRMRYHSICDRPLLWLYWVPPWGVSNGSWHNWKCFLANKKIKMFF